MQNGKQPKMGTEKREEGLVMIPKDSLWHFRSSQPLNTAGIWQLGTVDKIYAPVREVTGLYIVFLFVLTGMKSSSRRAKL